MKIKLMGIISSLFAILILFITLSNNQGTVNPDTITGGYDFSNENGVFLNKNIKSEELSAKNEVKKTNVLGEITGSKRIEIDLTNQRLYAFMGEYKIYDFLISSGKWGKTPTGTFHIWGKFRYTKMSGGSKALKTYYYLPNVPYVMFFENETIPAKRGFGIHGTYWHDNFGHPMSHGCINMKTEEAGLLYNWAMPNLGENKSGRATTDNPGTEVIIYGIAPRS